MNLLEDAISAVRIGEKIVMKFFDDEKNIKHKGKFDLVTEADIACEKAIVDFLKEKYPDHGFVVEEGDDIRPEKEYVWVIDPIDGTTSFSHNYPMFSISVGLFKDKKPYLGAVLIPALDELFFAELNKGAFLEKGGKKGKIKVSSVETLEKSLLSTGFPYDREEKLDDSLEIIRKVMKKAQGLRRSGSCAIDICFVACGRTDGYWESGLKIVDSAAARIILSEAGGKITDYEGREISEDTECLVVSNKNIHEELLNTIKGER